MKTRKVSILTYILILAAAVQFMVIVWFNYRYAYGLLNMDTSMGIRQNVEQWKHGLFLKDFVFATTLSNDYASFFAVPVFLLTNNLRLTMAVGQVLAYVIIVLVLRDICANLKATVEQFLFSVLVVFTPYSIDVLDWAYLLFVSVGYWTYRVIALLLLFDLLLLSEQPKVSRVKFAAVFAGSCFMTFWTSLSTGNYIICMVVLPFILKVIWDIVSKQQFSWRSKSNWVIAASCISAMAGWIYRNMNLPEMGRDHNNLSLLTADTIFDNLSNAIAGVFMLFGGLTNVENVSIFSTPGVLILLRFAFLCVSIVLVAAECIRKKGGGSLIRSFLCVFLVNMGVLLLTNTSYSEKIFESRYHLLWCIPFLLVAASVAMKPPYDNRWMNTLISYGFVAALAVINLGGFYILSQQMSDRGYEKAILEVADENEVDTIFVYNNPAIAYNLRAMDLKKESVGVTCESGYIAINEWGYYAACAENATSDKPNILICQDTQFAKLPEYVKKAYTLVDAETFGNGHNGYYAERSPWDYLYGMPLASEDRSVDFPYTKGYEYSGTIDDKGCLIADTDDQGIVLTSPNCTTAPGLYNVTVVYEIQDSGSGASGVTLEIAANNGENVLLSGELPANETSFTLKNVKILSEFELSFRIRKNGDSTISIQKLIFERIDSE